ncbi:monovalent cation:proton antiporter-2 (CPA2) family protein [Myxococcus sp. RHSTA-1-4]|uniref:monovalent cation:proton antiporter-2 (CPA2) family protein n=1 Tax=Myxococcus sp. RHSTA-1-4 TaxID=2874601 RepID=UPI001CBAB7CF|nr:monovalent cation:proton antiporter-2 (CPA2) family protein [Myxococcus sp. RHSTA-1-4]MBZ4416624.1 monovalent cation:proton antiporter-2 (CPA2) family protein [Myxococcus sp. RHSTA-1-4]
MAASSQDPVYVQALIFLGAAVVAVPLFRKLRLGSILGYLAAGLVIGPFGLGLFKDSTSTMHVAELGVVLFLFVIGLELNLTRLWAMRRDIFVLGTAQVVLTGLLAMLYPLLVAGRPWKAALIAGLGLALSSTALVMQMLGERGEVQQPHGQKAFAILLLQDLAIVPLLALVALLSPQDSAGSDPLWLSSAKMLGAVAVVVLTGRYLLSPFFRVLASAGAHEVMTAAALLVVIAAAALMTSVGLSSALGAFLAGVLLAESSYRHELEADIEPFRGLLLGLFFISVGMTVDLKVIASHWALLLGALVTITAIKTAVVYGLLRLMRNGHEVAVRTALLLPQGGEFGFVLFSTAVAAGVMRQEQATLLVALVTLTMALTPLLAVLAPRLARTRAAQPEREVRFDGVKGSVLIIGFGRFGQVVSQLLLAEGVDVTTIENDVEMIEAAERFGFKVYYGDGTRLDVLRAAGAEQATLICVCVEHKEAATHIVELCRASFPLARLYVRSYDRGHSLELLEKGAHFQMRETFESAIAFGRAALVGLGLPPERVAAVEEDIRQRDRDRFAMQQQGREPTAAGKDTLYTRPAPRPEPFVHPQRQAVSLNPAPRPEDAPGKEGDKERP